MKSKLIQLIEHTPIGNRLLKDHRFRLILFAVLNMGWSLFYAVFNGILGIVYRSGWFGTMCAYYAVLGLMKLNIVLSERIKPGAETERRNMLATGIGLLFLTAILALIVALSIADAVGKKYHIIVMITIATFTFFMVGRAIVSAVQAHRQGDRVSIMLPISLSPPPSVPFCRLSDPCWARSAQVQTLSPFSWKAFPGWPVSHSSYCLAAR